MPYKNMLLYGSVSGFSFIRSMVSGSRRLSPLIKNHGETCFCAVTDIII